jgi:YVTN family beta-propeller protein
MIDGQTNSVITTITTGTSPFTLVWNSTNNKVYCANYSNNVTVIDGQTNSVITTITVGNGPRSFCWNSIQNRIYVANWSSSNISVIRDSMVSGVEEKHSVLSADHNSLEIYPNPARSHFTIRLPEILKQVDLHLASHQNDKCEIKIFDVSGKVVKEILRSAQNDNNVRVSLDGIKNGVYFIKVNDEMVKEKLIITK